MPGKRLFRLLVLAALFTLLIPLAVTTPGAAADGDEDQFTIPEKAELKYPNLGSSLDQLVARVEEGEATADDAAGDAPVHRAESVAVTIYLSGNVDDVVQFLEDFGGDPRNVGQDYIEAYVPVTLLGPVSEQPGVLRVREIIPPQDEYGDFTSQGVQAHLSAAWNQAGYSGQGIKVGVIDSYFGFRSFRSLMGTELPTPAGVRCYPELGVVTAILSDCEDPEKGSVHGTAVAEAVMDIAPEVDLYIASPLTRGDVHNVVEWMLSQGVKVIIRSESSRFDGPGDGTSPYSDSPLKAVDRAVDGGIIWVNSAGNSAQETWFGPYSDTDGNGLVSFAEPEIEFVGLDVKEGERVTVQLRWEDDWDGAATDLDLYLYNIATGMFTRAKSEDEQSGEIGQVPLEGFWFTLDGDSNAHGIVIGHYSGDIPDWIQVMVWGAGDIEYHTGKSSITNPGESANPGLLAVGAAHYYDTNTIASYSSRGPTPDERAEPKPDIVGTACAETASYSPRPRDENQCWFPGTSQAAPHVAGLAALVRQRFPDYTPVQVAAYLKDHAQQRETPDPNNTWGHGFARLPSPDREALVALYNATGGANWTNNDGWLTDAPIGQWHGATTDASGRVTRLDLADNQLTGSIPDELGSLSSLEVLDLNDNQLTGEIPTSLGSIANLVQLQITGNQLTGTIPAELGSLANLTILALGGNQLTGTIPTWLGNLTNLEELYLWENELTGTIPTELGSLAKLKELWLSENRLTGEIPAELGNLELLSLSDNQLTGEIPAELGNLANLDRLFASRNQLSGSIPSQVARLTNISQISLYENQLTGEIPSELGSLSNLELLSLTRNQLTGPIPAELGSLTSLEILALGGNQLTGTIPTWLGSLTNLEGLYLWGNQLTGEIPSQLGNLTNLTGLELSDNQLSGVVLPTLAGLTKLERFTFYNNLGLCAPVDDAFQTWLRGISIVHGSMCAADSPEDRAVLVQIHNATGGANWTNSDNWLSEEHFIREWYGVTNDANGRVHVLFLGGNQLTGEIPAQLGNLTKLEWVSLNQNQLTGEIPPELGSLANLERLRLYNNQLTGEIPAELGSMTNLDHLRLDGNQLTGEIPAELGRLTNLTVLHLAGNQLTGCVPASWRDVEDNDFAQLGLPFCPSGDPLITRYDDNRNGTIERSEVIKAINDYLFGEGDQTISRADVIMLINLYLFGPPASQQSEASGELDGGGQRADADRPVVEIPRQQRGNGHHGLPD